MIKLDKHYILDLSMFVNGFSSVTAIANVRTCDGAIGSQGKLLNCTRHAQDMRLFVTQSRGSSCVLMGRKTADSIAPDWRSTGIVLPGRSVAVASYAPSKSHYSTVLQWCGKPEYSGRILIAGGQALYEMLLPMCHQVLLTSTAASADEMADSYFPVAELDKCLTLRSSTSYNTDKGQHCQLQCWQKAIT